jgi:hypothetical protein
LLRPAVGAACPPPPQARADARCQCSAAAPQKKKFNFKFTSHAVQEQLAAPGGGRRLPAAATGPRRRALPVQCRGAAKKKKFNFKFSSHAVPQEQLECHTRYQH